jgi:cardiolipin synthase
MTDWRVLTWPNLISFLRLLGVGLFLWLLLGVQADGGRSVVLAVGGSTDWVDGFLARRLGQVSRLGELLDPFVDRLYIVATVIALTIRDVLPLWFTLALLAREAVHGRLPAGAAPGGLRAAAGALRGQGGHLHPAVRHARPCCWRR